MSNIESQLPFSEYLMSQLGPVESLVNEKIDLQTREFQVKALGLKAGRIVMENRGTMTIGGTNYCCWSLEIQTDEKFSRVYRYSQWELALVDASTLLPKALYQRVVEKGRKVETEYWFDQNGNKLCLIEGGRQTQAYSLDPEAQSMVTALFYMEQSDKKDFKIQHKNKVYQIGLIYIGSQTVSLSESQIFGISSSPQVSRLKDLKIWLSDSGINKIQAKLPFATVTANLAVDSRRR